MKLFSFLKSEPEIHPSAFPQFVLGDGQISKWAAEIIEFEPDPENGKITRVTFRFTTDGLDPVDLTERFTEWTEDRLTQYAQQWIAATEKEEARQELLSDPSAILKVLELTREPSALEVRRAEIGTRVRTLDALLKAAQRGLLKSDDSRIVALQDELKAILATDEAPLLLGL